MQNENDRVAAPESLPSDIKVDSCLKYPIDLNKWTDLPEIDDWSS